MASVLSGSGQSISSLVGNLEKQRRRRLADLVVGHDLGLAHYWRAKAQNTSENQKRHHWKTVIANWSPVLESDDYWQQWARERALVYQKEISEDHLRKVRSNLREHLSADLAKAFQNDGDFNLELAFHLELAAVRLLQPTGGVPVAPLGEGRALGGPLLFRQLGLTSVLPEFFRSRPRPPSRNAASLKEIVGDLADEHKTGWVGTSHHPERELRLCFSELGPAWLSLTDHAPQRALRLLAVIQCPHCPASPEDVELGLPSRCRDGCSRFSQANPGYAATAEGSSDFIRNSVEIGAAAHLSTARQLLAEPSVSGPDLISHLDHAVAMSGRLGLADELRRTIRTTLLGWIEGVAAKGRFDEAIELLEASEDWLTEEKFHVELASLLNRRAVKIAEAEDWSEAADDLRRARRLNPAVKLYTKNLQNVLAAWAESARTEGDQRLSLDILDEMSHLGDLGGLPPHHPEGAPRDSGQEPPHREAPPPHQSRHSVEEPHDETTRTIFLSREARVVPELIDASGRPRTDRFTPPARDVLTRANALAISQSLPYIRPRELLAALASQPDGLTARLIREQGVSPTKLVSRLSGSLLPEAGETAPAEDLPGLDDIHRDVFETLRASWDISEYDDRTERQVSELHLLCGLLISGKVAQRLENEGLNVHRMLNQACWPDKEG